MTKRILPKLIFFSILFLLVFSILFVSAQEVPDINITNVRATPASTTRGATTSYTLSFKFTEAFIIGTGEVGQIGLNFNPNRGEPSNANTVNLSNATLASITGVNGTLADWVSDMPKSYRGINVEGPANIAPNTTVTLTLANVVNPSVSGAYRLSVETAVFAGPGEPRRDHYGENPAALMIGNVAYGRVLDPNGDPVPYCGVRIFKEDFSVEVNEGTDDTGYFFFNDVTPGTYLLKADLPPSVPYMPPDPKTITVTSGINNLGTIALFTPPKTVTGKVLYPNGNPVTTASVHANMRKGRGWSSTNVNSNGGYSLGLTGGEWELRVEPQWDPEANQQMDVDWAYLDFPQFVSFASNDTTERATANFSVVVATAVVKGKVVYPNGSPCNRGGVDVRSSEGRGAGGGLNERGIFSIHVPAGTYKIGIFLDNQDYAAPSIEPFSVGENETKNLGTITLVAKNEHIKGVVTGSGPVANVRINAWKPEAHGWAETLTGSDGTYDLLVTPGNWEVMPQPDPSLNYVYEAGPPTRVSVAVNQTVTGVNFTLTATDSSIKGRVVDVNGNVLTNFWGFAMAMRGTGDQPMPGPGTEVEGGTFTLNVPHGTWTVNVDAGPESDYTSAGGKTVTLDAGDTTWVTITMKTNDATITGFIYNEAGTPITGVEAEIFAHSPAGAFKHTRVNPNNGSYTMGVVGGMDWFMGVFVRPNSGYMEVPPDDNKISVTAGQTITRNFTLLTADATVSGTVYDPNGNPLPNVFVFLDSHAVEEGEVLGAFTDTEEPVGGVKAGGGPGIHTGDLTASDGTFTLAVPAGTYGLGSGAPSSLGYINPPIQKVTISSGGSVTGLTLTYRAADGTISGSIYLSGAKHNGFVWAWSESGGYSETFSFTGDYALNVTKNETWHIGADYGTQNKFYQSPEYIVYVGASGSATQDLVMTEAPYTMPPASTRTFDASMPMTIVLEDGMTISIPAGALTTSGNVTVMATPTAELAKQQNSRPVAFGYEITALNSSGQTITDFNADVTITIPYTEEMLTALGITEDDLAAAYFSEDTSLWSSVTGIIIDRDNNKVIITVDHFTSFALVTGGSDTTPPSAPTNVTAADPGTDGKVTLSWTNPTNADFDHINIYRSTTSGTLGDLVHSTTSTSTTSWEDSGLTNGTTYYYTLKAVDTNGNESVNVSQVSATPSGPAELPATGTSLFEAVAMLLEQILVGIGVIATLLAPRFWILRELK